MHTPSLSEPVFFARYVAFAAVTEHESMLTLKGPFWHLSYASSRSSRTEESWKVDRQPYVQHRSVLNLVENNQFITDLLRCFEAGSVVHLIWGVMEHERSSECYQLRSMHLYFPDGIRDWSHHSYSDLKTERGEGTYYPPRMRKRLLLS